LALATHILRGQKRKTRISTYQSPIDQPNRYSEKNLLDMQQTVKQKSSSGSIKINLQTIFTGLTLIVLSLQLYIYWRQTNIMERQVYIAEIQAELLQRQSVIEDAGNRVELQNARASIKFFYLPSGVEGLRALPIKDKVTWIRNVQDIIDSQIKNPALIHDMDCFEHWIMARKKAQAASEALLEYSSRSAEQGRDDYLASIAEHRMNDTFAKLAGEILTNVICTSD
jgi:hypothetical protein